MTLRPAFTAGAAGAMFAVIAATGVVSAQKPAAPAPPPSEASVALSALQAVMPHLDGWAKVDAKMKHVTLHKDCSFAFVSATYVKDDMRVVITLADAGSHADSLMSLVPMIAILPDGYAEDVPPATTIKRVKIDGSPAAESWDGNAAAGEIGVLVNERMVAKVEGWKLENLDALRALLHTIDLKKLGELK